MVLTLLTNEGGIFVFMEIDIQICRVKFYRQFTKNVGLMYQYYTSFLLERHYR